jgi:hypothetical protein
MQRDGTFPTARNGESCEGNESLGGRNAGRAWPRNVGPGTSCLPGSTSTCPRSRLLRSSKEGLIKAPAYDVAAPAETAAKVRVHRLLYERSVAVGDDLRNGKSIFYAWLLNFPGYRLVEQMSGRTSA